MKNNYKITDFPEGSRVLFNDGEEWLVVKPGMRGSSNRRNSDEITIKPFNKLAKDRNISLPIDATLDYINNNIKKIINESEVNESNNIVVGTFVRYKKDKDFTGGKVKSIKSGNAEIHNWDGSTTELPLKDLEYVKSWNESEVNEARITWGEELAYNLNHDSPSTFVKAYEGQSVDIFFTKDHRSAIVTQRTRNIISHGKDSGKSMNLTDVKFVYCGIEKEFYSVEDYKKLLKAVYGGKRASIKPMNISESEINEGKTQIKRKYGEHSAINVYERGPIRNKIIEFVKNKHVTEAELKEYVKRLAEERGSEFDANKWFKRNERYFESYHNRGQNVFTLSKYGNRVYEYIVKKENQKQINESVGLFKINESDEIVESKGLFKI
jgi:hypothetical protein